MHGPEHLFCCGVDQSSIGLSLSHAAWAGYCQAKGSYANAEEYAAAARAAAGHALVGQSGGPGFLYVVSETRLPEVVMIDMLIEQLKLVRGVCERHEKKQAEEQSAISQQPTTTEPARPAEGEGQPVATTEHAEPEEGRTPREPVA